VAPATGVVVNQLDLRALADQCNTRALSPTPQARMILRHDRHDRDCIVDAADWPSIVAFFDGDGGATLVGDRWLLTAAHTAANLTPDHRVRIGGVDIRVSRVIAHPGCSGRPVDLALVELAAPAVGVPVIALHMLSNEAGREALLLGRGDFGDGRQGVVGTDHRLRCVTNRVDSVDERWLRLRFDRPTDCTALEGVGGEGDSGGPALLRTGDELTIAGVSSWQDHAGALGTYGCVEYYARVSSHAGWITSAMTGGPDSHSSSSAGAGERRA
jgi:Trypsin